MAQTQTAPAQTQAEIVAALRAQNAKSNSAVWNVLRTIPLLPLGGAVDLGNAVAGTLAGKGFLKPLVEKPVGGLKDLKQKFRIPELAPDDTLGQVLEAGAGMMSPGGAAKAIIVPLTKTNKVAKTLGIENVVDRVEDMTKSGASTWKVGVESENALRKMRNPGGALSVFVGPDGIPRLKIDPAVATIPKSVGVEITPAWRGIPAEAKLPKAMVAGPNDLVGPERLLSDVLYHPSLYEISPTARTATVQHSGLLDLFGGGAGYSYTNNAVLLPRETAGPARIKNDPMGFLLESLLHESTHLLQKENAVRSGGAPRIDSILRTLTEAETSGSFRSPAQLSQLKAYAEALKKMPDSNRKQALINNLYMSNYGEWEARQGSQYGRSLPIMNERGATY